MDGTFLQITADIVLALVLFLGGLVVNAQNDKINNLQDKVDKLPETYARRDDVKDMKAEILDAIHNLSGKVEEIRRHG